LPNQLVMVFAAMSEPFPAARAGYKNRRENARPTRSDSTQVWLCLSAKQTTPRIPAGAVTLL